VVGVIVRDDALFNAMNQPVKDVEIPPLKHHLKIEEFERLILMVKRTGDPHSEMRLQIASEPSRSRLVAITNVRAVLFIKGQRFLSSKLNQANYLRAPDERSEETSQRIEGKVAERKDQEDENIEY
jgi:hypothetical protein